MLFWKMYTVVRLKTCGVQTGCSKADLKDQSTQCGSTQASYQRNEKQENFTSYENLLRDYLWDREFTLSWLRERGLIASSRNCTMCGSEMNWFGGDTDPMATSGNVEGRLMVSGIDVRGASEKEVGLKIRT